MDIKVSGLRKSYDGNVVFSDLELSLLEGRVNCLMGPSGSGKTTLARLLLRLEKPDAGDISGMDGRSCVAVFQEDRLCEGFTAMQNIMLATGKRFTKTDIEGELALVGLEGEGAKAVNDMSGGMRRRVAIIRAVLADGNVIIMDEPFKGLDVELRLKVAEYIKIRTVGKTLILITHEPQEAEMLGAENIVWLS